MKRDRKSHKGENGRIAVIGGSESFTGAPVISAMAAYRAGADLVRVLVPEENRDVTASFSPEIIVDTYSAGNFDWEALEEAQEVIQWADVAVIGPGGGEGDFSHLEEMLSEAVIDADAIGDLKETEDNILTPHSSEAEQLGDPESYVEETGNIVAVTGPSDRVVSEEGERVIARGDSSMTVGGTGDMLTGVIASLWAQGMSPEDATANGLRINGAAGEKAAEVYGKGALPSDMIDYIPEAVEDVLR